MAVNAFRPGSGATHVAANLAVALALSGQKVGLVDADLRTPSLHFLFNRGSEPLHGTLSEFLHGGGELGGIEIELPGTDPQILADSGQAGTTTKERTSTSGCLHFVPACPDLLGLDCRSHLVHNFDGLAAGLRAYSERLALDFLIVDTSSGSSPETLSPIAICDQLLLILTLDRQETLGSSVTIRVARELGVEEVLVVVNNVVAGLGTASIHKRVTDSYGCNVGGMVPYSDEIAALQSRGLYVLRHPHHPASLVIRQLARAMISDA